MYVLIPYYPHLEQLVDFPLFVAQPHLIMTHPTPSGKIIFLGACLIAAVRLAREERWDNADAIDLAERIL